MHNSHIKIIEYLSLVSLSVPKKPVMHVYLEQCFRVRFTPSKFINGILLIRLLNLSKIKSLKSTIFWTFCDTEFNIGSEKDLVFILQEM